MITYRVKLQNKKVVAEGTMAFFFEKPAGFSFQAGQNCDWTLINPPETDTEGNMRSFSLASAPYEELLMIASRMRDTAFKRTLKNMSPGTEVEMKGPMGDLTLHSEVDKPAVLLAGGIGITPLRSIVIDAALRHLPQKIYLFYSNRRPQDAAFLGELQSVNNPNFKFIATMTQDPSWPGEKGYINEAMLTKYMPDFKDGVFYLAGPTAMVTDLKHMLAQSAVSQLQVRTEEFTGY